MNAKSRVRGIDERSIDDRLVPWQEIEYHFANGAILIGNGFSQAVWKKFGYSSIYEAACSDEYTDHPLTLEDKRLFDLMKTTNFEMILSRLSAASEVNRAFGKEYNYLEERYEHIKTALGEAVRAVHVPWNRMTEEVLSDIRDGLKKYKFIYSTNYDLLPYWAIMSRNNGGGFKDFFWGKDLENPIDGDPYFDIADSRIRDNPTRIFYLHGALHIYRNSRTGRTYKFKNRGPSSLLNISEIPLFITEGSSTDKLNAIRNSDYLLFAYNHFLHHSAPLVVFGHSLSETDQHLIDAIRKSGSKRIAISIRKSNSSDEIRKRKANLYYSLCNGWSERQRPNLYFFNAQTHPLGSNNVRIEEYNNFPD